MAFNTSGKKKWLQQWFSNSCRTRPEDHVQTYLRKLFPNDRFRNLFRVFLFGGESTIGIWRRLLVHTLAGGLIGFWVLHPLSVIAHNLFYFETTGIWTSFGISLSGAHLGMTIYFTLVGSGFGLVHGIYSHMISGLYEEIRLQAITDELTGLYNRRYFMKRLQQEIIRSLRYQHSLSLLIVDIDYFKHFNDTYGHPAGDELLQQLGKLFRDMIRKSDFAARYGGEEFAVVLPETSGDMASALAKRICTAVSQFPFRYGGFERQGRITISGGMAVFPFDSQNVEGLIQKADQALYQAKATGRNRICHTG